MEKLFLESEISTILNSMCLTFKFTNMCQNMYLNEMYINVVVIYINFDKL